MRQWLKIIPFLVFMFIPTQALWARDYWVDASAPDGGDGSPAFPYRQIQSAASRAAAGDMVRILPGIYRETVIPANSGFSGLPIVYRAENGPDTAFIHGSVPSSSLAWTAAGDDVYWADISMLPTLPELIYEVPVSGRPIRYPKAHEPDFTVTTAWKHHENWRTAEGGGAAGNRSMYELTDAAHLSGPPDLKGAVVYMLDTIEAFYNYRRTVTSHDGATGTIGWTQKAEFDSGSDNPAIGMCTKYFIEGKSVFCDEPHEWYVENDRLYVRMNGAVDPATRDIEIAVRGIGVDCTDRSFLTFKDLNIRFINNRLSEEGTQHPEGAFLVFNYDAPQSSQYLVLDNLDIAHCGKGLRFIQSAVQAGHRTEHVTVRNCEIHDIEGSALDMKSWNYPQGAGVRGGYPHFIFESNHVHDVGFKAVAESHALMFLDVYKLIVRDNWIHDVAHKGVMISRAKKGDDAGEYILVQNNVIERTGLNHSEGAGIGAWDFNLTWLKTLIMGNVISDVHSWTHACAEAAAGRNPDGYSYYNGESGMGVNLDHVRGVNLYRNIVLDGSYFGLESTRDTRVHNNLVRGSWQGVSGMTQHAGQENVRIMNNILLDNYYGIRINPADTALTEIDHNLYQRTDGGPSWSPRSHLFLDLPSQNHFYLSVAEIQASPLFDWEAHGVENAGAPIVRNPSGETRDDFRLVSGAKAIDAGAPPAEIAALMTELSDNLGVPVADVTTQGPYDIGPDEYVMTPRPRGLRIRPRME
ncbi:MAG: right-handed parallel beta-helix repeat-containing protein [Vicinamibacteria bacterium]|nr:right-handed parallel beta-helix repeat-containing protein [Vicinamibacteria bacterium]